MFALLRIAPRSMRLNLGPLQPHSFHLHLLFGPPTYFQYPQSKPLTIKQQNMQSLLGSHSTSRSPSPSLPTHAEEQRALRSETISAFHAAVQSPPDDDDDELAGGLLTLREKTKDELERQEEEYRAYLEREVGDVRSLVRIEMEGSGSMDAEEEYVGAREAEGTRKGTKGKRRARKEETDQDFLLKCAPARRPSSTLAYYPPSRPTVTSSTAAGSTATPDIFQHTQT